MINEWMGYGVFAAAFIPKGAIVYVQDDLEVVLSPHDRRLRDERFAMQVEKYSFMDARGNRVLSWDLAKYVNHCCDPNTMSTGYGFEIAVRDILPGEEITDEYGLFQFDPRWEMDCRCGANACRGRLRHDDVLRLWPVWDERVRSALSRLTAEEQPLWIYLDANIMQELMSYLNTGDAYRSVRTVWPARPPRRNTRATALAS